MGCMHVCEDKQKKKEYDYQRQLKFIKETVSQIICFKNNFNIQFVDKCYQQICHNPKLFVLKYPNKVQEKQSIPVNILQKWKMILYGSGYQQEAYAISIGYNVSNIQEEKFNQERTFKVFKQNPFQINLNQLYYHESYSQIQKDIVRKYQIPELKQQSFQRILKKISNYFPSTGYALGINYIIGYFLIIGYSEIDSFWLFVHLALNKRFLALGLFQQGFPLAKILILLFKNVLKRINRAIYQHIFQKMFIDDSMWLLKWFMSFYLSSFPIEACQYVWDLVLTIGIFGLVYFAISLIQYLAVKILSLEDEGELALFFKSLNKLQTFNQFINLQKVMSHCYLILIQQEDFQGIQKQKPDFYTRYFSLTKKTNQLQLFYEQISTQRNKFKDLAKQSASKFYQPLTTQKQIQNSEIEKLSQNHQQKKQSIDQKENQHDQNKQVKQITQKIQFQSLQMRRVQSETLNIRIKTIQRNYSLNLVSRQHQKHSPIKKFLRVLKSSTQNKYQSQQYFEEFQQANQNIFIKKQLSLKDQQINSAKSALKSAQITYQVKVKSVKNQDFSQNQFQHSKEAVSRIEQFDKSVIKKQLKFKFEEPINSKQQEKKQPNSELQSIQQNFLRSQINQGLQSQFHISIYNIQDSKIQYQKKKKQQHFECIESQNNLKSSKKHAESQKIYQQKSQQKQKIQQDSQGNTKNTKIINRTLKENQTDKSELIDHSLLQNTKND